MFSSSTPPLNLSPGQEALSTLQERIQFFVQNRPEQWAYSIFWKKRHDTDGGLVLAWGAGHFKGTKVVHDTFGVGLEGKTSMEGDGSLDDLISDIEWFYIVSLTRSFAIGDDNLVGKVYSTCNSAWLNGIQELQEYSERAKEAQMHGIQTLVCIPTSSGVLELGSSELIKENLGLLQQATTTLFDSEVAALDSKQPLSPGTFLPLLDTVQFSFADTGMPAGVDKKGEAEIQIMEAAMTEQSSTLGSEHSNFDGVIEKRKPKKRGRKPRIDGKEYHVMAERQRREKLNHLFDTVRAVVPNVSGMDKATLLDAAVSYINKLKAKVGNLETTQARMSSKITKLKGKDIHEHCTIDNHYSSSHSDSKGLVMMEVEVKIIGPDAKIRLQCKNMNHPSARLMGALRDLEFVVLHMSAWSVEDVMIQQVLASLPKGLGTEERAKAALVSRLLS
ncbi:Transcription factor like [Thalictrum thalictroides]|uniref:Transcription factor n=1 Tax=Thalictrum thalictroides TaxID=46969 RepID=A0A7J6X057_THATH|nr:Transcription factor like [Thalictrum thalictroides]